LLLNTSELELALLGGALGCLQGIDRSRTRKPATFSRRFLCLVNYDVTAIGTRNTAFDDQQVLVFVESQHTPVTYCGASIAQVAGHPHTFKHAGGKCRGADRTGDLEHGTVRLGTTTEVMTLHDTGESMAFADADDVDEFLAFEDVDEDTLSDFHRA